jgi:hypothetical protein
VNPLPARVADTWRTVSTDFDEFLAFLDAAARIERR